MFYTSKIVLISLFLTFNFVLSIDNCKTESEGQCVLCEDHFTLSNNTCLQCDDPNCLHCFSSKPNTCYSCADSFVLTYKKCGRRCDNIDQCDICSDDLSQCYHCMHGCQVSMIVFNLTYNLRQMPACIPCRICNGISHHNPRNDNQNHNGNNQNNIKGLCPGHTNITSLPT